MVVHTAKAIVISYEGLWKMNPDNGFSSKGSLGQASANEGIPLYVLPDLGGYDGRDGEAYHLKYDEGNMSKARRNAFADARLEKNGKISATTSRNTA